MEEICRRLTEVEGAVEGLQTATAAGADHIEELNHRLATHEASAAGAVERINTRLAGLQEEISKETADRHGAISHLHAALTEKISATHVEQMFQKLQAESAAKDRDALLKEEVNDRRLREIEAGIADIRVEVARDAERIGELRHDVDAQLRALRERIGRNREVRIPAFTMRSEEGDDGVMTLEPVIHHVSQAGASD
jgi:predicted  nucleic acid-binding Zn-ribbon protein